MVISEGRLAKSDATIVAWMTPVRFVLLEEETSIRRVVSSVPNVIVLSRDWLVRAVLLRGGGILDRGRTEEKRLWFLVC